MDPASFVLVALAGLAAGVASGLFGVGGGVLMVPAALYLVPGTGFHEAKAASLVVICASAGIGIWTHRRRGSVDLRRGGWLALGGAVGTAASVLAVERVTDTALALAFGVFLAAVGAHMAWGRAPRERPHVPRPGPLVALGLAGGLLAGAFGIGGGVVMVPGMVLAGVGVHLAVGTSLVAVLGNAAAGTAAHLLLPGYGAALLALGVPLALGAVPGTHLGSVLAHKLHAARLKWLFGIFLVAIGAAIAIDAAIP